MVTDAARVKDLDTDNNGESGSDEAGGGKVEHRELKTKEDINDYQKQKNILLEYLQYHLHVLPYFQS